MGSDSVLVILDNVWKALQDNDLNTLGIPIGSNHNHRCKVILATRYRDVCSRMNGLIIDVGTLPEKEAWILFRQKAGNSVDDPSLHKTAKAVAEKCKGLPLAIITVAGVQNGKKSKHSWEDALAQLERSAPRHIPEVIKDVYQHL